MIQWRLAISCYFKSILSIVFYFNLERSSILDSRLYNNFEHRHLFFVMWSKRKCNKIEHVVAFMRFSFVVWLFQYESHVITGVGANPDAKRLYDDLLSHYNRLIRPVSNNSQVVTVRLGLHLTQLIDLVRKPFSCHFQSRRNLFLLILQCFYNEKSRD